MTVIYGPGILDNKAPNKERVDRGAGEGGGDTGISGAGDGDKDSGDRG